MTVTAIRDNKNKPDPFKTSFLYCENLGHLIKYCCKKIRKEKEQEQKSTEKKIKTFSPETSSFCSQCHSTDHSQEKCWSGPKAADRSQKFKQHSSTGDKQNSLTESTSTKNRPPSILKNSLNY